MTDIIGPNVSPGSSPTPPVVPAGSQARRGTPGAREAQSTGAPCKSTSDTRAVFADISGRALAIQRGATAVRKATETLDYIEEAIVFALDAAEEATSARSLPESALGALQLQMDMAINCMDCAASQARFGESSLFDGEFALDIEGRRLAVPKISSQNLGGSASGAEAWGAYGTAVQYSQSIASAGSGGPNSLLVCAGGATAALANGLTKLREVRQALASFHEETIVPRAGELAVALANAVASESHTDNLGEVTRILSEVRRELRSAPRQGAGVNRSEGVLRLLE